jgi:large conductance mechanosensitive channel
MPPIGWILSGVDFANLFVLLKRGKKNSITKGAYKSLTQAKDDGAVTVNVGVVGIYFIIIIDSFSKFLNSVINFSVISVIIFVIIRTINQIKKKEKKKIIAKHCTHCFSKIDKRAKKCPVCTSVQENVEEFPSTSTNLDEDNDERMENDDADDHHAFKPVKSKWVKPKHFIKKELSRSQILF